MTSPADNGTRRTFLPEVEGLRAIAVGVVLLFHAKLGFTGGYVGVDVFFVVSGFLITGLLVRELETTGTIRFREFYARRARRLLPAATLVLIVTIVLARLLLDRVRAHETAIDATWAAGFLANFHFAIQGADYFRRGAEPSLVQHWWSLAVEEQFYLVWPMALAGLAWLRHRMMRRHRVRAVVLVPAAAITIVGFLVGRWLTSSRPSWGYFATWSRGWELALGAVVAIVWNHQPRLLVTRRLRAVTGMAGWAGLAAIAASALWFDGRTPFPGIAALMPVLGTVAVLASIGAPLGPGRLLSVEPMQWIGGRSYGIYLWHWPILMLAAARLTDPGPWTRAGLLALSIAAAAAAYTVLENPVRHHRSLVDRPARSLMVGGALVAMAAGGGAIVSSASSRLTVRTGSVVAPLVTPTIAPLPADSSPASGGGSTSSLAPDRSGSLLDQLAARVSAELQPIIRTSSINEQLPDNLDPALPDVRGDHVHQLDRGCLVRARALVNEECTFGDPAGTTTIAVFGDSHSVEWFPALELLSSQRGWRIKAYAKAGCPAATVGVRGDDFRPYKACDIWRQRTIERLKAEKVDLVITTNFSGYYGHADPKLTPEVWRDGLFTTVQKLREGGVRVLVISDTPTMGRGPTSCLEWNRHHITDCSVPRLQSEFTNIERESAAAGGYFFYDSTDWFCVETCPLVIGNIAVYYDLYHVTRTYGRFLAPYVDLVVRNALTSPAPTPASP